MNQTFLILRFEQIEKRLNEIDLLLNLANDNTNHPDVYQALCRSAHVLLVSHFEGLYKDICRDVIDDINSNTKFYQVRKDIFNTFCDYFILVNDNTKSTQEIRLRLLESFKDYPSNLKVGPFLQVDNKNPTPKIIENILEKFGINSFFWSLQGSDLDIVFEDLKSETEKLRNKLLRYLKRNTISYPYTVDRSIYNPIDKTNTKKTKTLWEDFINNFLKERHNIVHGHTVDNPIDHDGLHKAKIQIEILLYVYIINICSTATPLIFLPDKQ